MPGGKEEKKPNRVRSIILYGLVLVVILSFGLASRDVYKSRIFSSHEKEQDKTTTYYNVLPF